MSTLDAQAVAAFTGPYKRVTGKHSAYPAVDVEALHAAHAAAEAARTRRAVVVERAVAPPTASTTVSARELQSMLKANIAPRYAPCDRFTEPLTASMDVGWRVGQKFSASLGVTGASMTGSRGAATGGAGGGR